MRRACGRAVTDRQVQAFSQQVNRGGVFDFGSVQQILGQTFKNPQQEEMELLQAFEMLDQHKTGTISEKELRDALAAQGDPLTASQVLLDEKVIQK